MNRRQIMLEAIRAAKDIHRELRLKDTIDEAGGRIDVFRIIRDLEYCLLFRPLDGLLGMSVQIPAPGMLISSLRPLHIQRFTAGHELGHLMLEHEGSIDLEIFDGAEDGGQEPEELAANTFASELLIPKWLIAYHLRRHEWREEDLHQSMQVYQLSLRMGVSYAATCWALLTNQMVNRVDLQSLLKQEPKGLKRQLLGQHTLDDPWADVWLIDAHDNEAWLEGGPNDVFILNLEEHGSGGYLWDTEKLEEHGFEIIDERAEFQAHDSPRFGGVVERRVVVRAVAPGAGELHLQEERPWSGPVSARANFHLRFDLRGKEEGLPRLERTPIALSA